MPRGKRERSEKGTFKAKFENPEDLQAAIDEYFDEVEARGEIVSEQGLALHLGVGLGTMQKWESGENCPYLQETVRGAYARMVVSYMQLLLTGNKNMTPFVIFMLKQRRFAAYQDKIEAKTDIAVNVKMGSGMDESDFK